MAHWYRAWAPPKGGLLLLQRTRCDLAREMAGVLAKNFTGSTFFGTDFILLFYFKKRAVAVAVVHDMNRRPQAPAAHELQAPETSFQGQS